MVQRSPQIIEVMKIIEENRLFETITYIDPFVQEIMLEFYSNFHIFPEDTKKVPVFMRGKMYELSPMMIYKVFRTSLVAWNKKSEVE